MLKPQVNSNVIMRTFVTKSAIWFSENEGGVKGRLELFRKFIRFGRGMLPLVVNISGPSWIDTKKHLFTCILSEQCMTMLEPMRMRCCCFLWLMNWKSVSIKSYQVTAKNSHQIWLSVRSNTLNQRSIRSLKILKKVTFHFDSQLVNHKTLSKSQILAQNSY